MAPRPEEKMKTHLLPHHAGKTAIICPIILGCELNATARVIRTMKNMKVHLEQIDPDRDILFWSINYLPVTTLSCHS